MNWRKYLLGSSDPKPHKIIKIPVKQLGLSTGQVVIVRRGEQRRKMIIPNINTVGSASEARELAIQWQHWQAEQSLSYSELADYQAYFMRIANKFNLTEEFKENSII